MAYSLAFWRTSFVSLALKKIFGEIGHCALDTLEIRLRDGRPERLLIREDDILTVTHN